MNQFQNPMLMIQKFNEFKNSFRGNPREEVQKLLSTGKITQTQLNQLQSMAGQFQQLINSFK